MSSDPSVNELLSQKCVCELPELTLTTRGSHGPIICAKCRRMARPPFTKPGTLVEGAIEMFFTPMDSTGK